MKKYIFLVANLNHVSVEALRKRGESFAHFWYQSITEATGTSVLLGSPLPFPYLLKSGSDRFKVRFERNNIFSITGELNDHIGTFTDPSELEYVMTKFLSFLKLRFQSEN